MPESGDSEFVEATDVKDIADSERLYPGSDLINGKTASRDGGVIHSFRVNDTFTDNHLIGQPQLLAPSNGEYGGFVQFVLNPGEHLEFTASYIDGHPAASPKS